MRKQLTFEITGQKQNSFTITAKLTDIFIGKVLTFSLRFKLYLKTYFPPNISTSLAITFEAILPIEFVSIREPF